MWVLHKGKMNLAGPHPLARVCGVAEAVKSKGVQVCLSVNVTVTGKWVRAHNKEGKVQLPGDPNGAFGEVRNLLQHDSLLPLFAIAWLKGFSMAMDEGMVKA